jgi:hypothetical protein
VPPARGARRGFSAFVAPEAAAVQSRRGHHPPAEARAARARIAPCAPRTAPSGLRPLARLHLPLVGADVATRAAPHQTIPSAR